MIDKIRRIIKLYSYILISIERTSEVVGRKMENSEKSSQSEAYDFLNQIFNLLVEENAFAAHDDKKKSIVDFKHPVELEVW